MATRTDQLDYRVERMIEADDAERLARWLRAKPRPRPLRALALIECCCELSLSCAEVLLKNDSGILKPKNPDKDACPLTTAACHKGKGQVALMRLLFAHGANPNEPDFDGRTPIIAAGMSESIRAIRVLAEHGADVNAATENGETALSYCVCWNRPRGVVELMRQGARLDTTKGIGHDPFHFAVEENHPNIVRLMLREGADPHRKDKYGRLPIEIARERGFVKCEHILQKAMNA